MGALNREQIIRLLDGPLSWGTVAFILGLAVGAHAGSVWPLAIALIGYLFYLRWHGPAHPDTETRLFATGPVALIAWLFGVVVRGWAF